MPILRLEDISKAKKACCENQGRIKMKEKIDEETAGKLQEMAILEQSIQNLSLQKQSLQFEISETLSALEELKKSGDKEAFKIVGQIMVKSKKEELEKELNEKKDMVELRANSIEKQEHSLRERLLSMREEVMKKLK